VKKRNKKFGSSEVSKKILKT